MRKVAGVYTVLGDGGWEDVEFDLGYLRCWGVRDTEFYSESVTDSVAIVELPDGRVVVPFVNEIRFLDTQE